MNERRSQPVRASIFEYLKCIHGRLIKGLSVSITWSARILKKLADGDHQFPTQIASYWPQACATRIHQPRGAGWLHTFSGM